MTFQKRLLAKGTTKGMLLAELLFVFAFCALFAAVLSEMLHSATYAFYRAQDRNTLTDSAFAYTPHIYQFGNERRMNAYSSSSPSQEVTFFEAERVGSSTPISSQPLCAVDLRNQNPLGSFSHVMSSSGTTSLSIETIHIPIPSSVPLTHLQIRGEIAYISADPSASADPDMYRIDISDRAHPVVLSSINTGPGISSFVLVGKRIYAAALSSAFQIHDIYIGTGNTLSLEARYRLPPPYATATQPLGSTIAYDAGRLFLGTEKWDGPEVAIMNTVNPAALSYAGGIETNAKVNDIYIRNNIAYISSAAENQEIEADISDGVHPRIRSTFSPSGWQRQEGKVVNSFEDTLIFGRTSGGYDVATDFELFTSSSTLGEGNGMDIPGGIYGIRGDKSSIYSISRQVGKELLIQPATGSSSLQTFSLPSQPQSLTCEGNHLYILSHTVPEIYDITIR